MTAASARGVARLVADAAHGIEVVVTRHHKPVAAVVGVERLAELDAVADDLRDLALVIARTADDERPTHRSRRRRRRIRLTAAPCRSSSPIPRSTTSAGSARLRHAAPSRGSPSSTPTPPPATSLATIDTGYRKLSAPDGTWRVVYTVDADVVDRLGGLGRRRAQHRRRLRRGAAAHGGGRRTRRGRARRDPRTPRPHHRHRPGPPQPHRRTRPRLARRRAPRTHRPSPASKSPPWTPRPPSKPGTPSPAEAVAVTPCLWPSIGTRAQMPKEPPIATLHCVLIALSTPWGH